MMLARASRSSRPPRTSPTGNRSGRWALGFGSFLRSRSDPGCRDARSWSRRQRPVRTQTRSSVRETESHARRAKARPSTPATVSSGCLTRAATGPPRAAGSPSDARIACRVRPGASLLRETLVIHRAALILRASDSNVLRLATPRLLTGAEREACFGSACRTHGECTGRRAAISSPAGPGRRDPAVLRRAATTPEQRRRLRAARARRAGARRAQSIAAPRDWSARHAFWPPPFATSSVGRRGGGPTSTSCARADGQSPARPWRHVVVTVSDRVVRSARPYSGRLGSAHARAGHRTARCRRHRHDAGRGALHERLHPLLPGIEEVRFEPQTDRGCRSCAVRQRGSAVHVARDREEEVAALSRGE